MQNHRQADRNQVAAALDDTEDAALYVEHFVEYFLEVKADDGNVGDEEKKLQYVGLLKNSASAAQAFSAAGC